MFQNPWLPRMVGRFPGMKKRDGVGGKESFGKDSDNVAQSTGKAAVATIDNGEHTSRLK